MEERFNDPSSYSPSTTPANLTENPSCLAKRLNFGLKVRKQAGFKKLPLHQAPAVPRDSGSVINPSAGRTKQVLLHYLPSGQKHPVVGTERPWQGSKQHHLTTIRQGTQSTLLGTLRAKPVTRECVLTARARCPCFCHHIWFQGQTQSQRRIVSSVIHARFLCARARNGSSLPAPV